MPRLLLVDDNQSIHKIAETLLASSDIELVCASSGAEALEKAAGPVPFDVALLDTSMQGMDGWELLERLRADPATSLLPVAMMAGVLDVVDPATLEKAPIQGFLKKPVELRDLAERVRTLLSTPVEPPKVDPPAFETMPYHKPSDPLLADLDDLLLLEPDDVLEDEPVVAAAATAGGGDAPVASSMESLELEELDLEGLKTLSTPDGEEALPESDSREVPTVEDLGQLPDFSPEDAFQDDLTGLITDELPDLGAAPAVAEAPSEKPAPSSLPQDWSDESETLLDLSADAVLADTEEDVIEAPAFPEPDLATQADLTLDGFGEPAPEPTPTLIPGTPLPPTPASVPPSQALEDLPEPEEVLESAGRDTVPPWVATQDMLPPVPEPLAEAIPALAAEAEPEPAVPAVPSPAATTKPEPPASGDPLAAVLADPALMDRLAEAVVARLGEKILREIAWEVIPDIAERLGRN
jgi:CheY-like chemotaxis protein